MVEAFARQIALGNRKSSNTEDQNGPVSNEFDLSALCTKVSSRFRIQDSNQLISASVFIIQNLLQQSLPRSRVLQLKKQLKILHIAATERHAQGYDDNCFVVSTMVP